MPANLETLAVATGLEKVSFHPNPTERQCQRITRRDKASVISAKKLRKTIEWERLEISSRKLEIPREHFMQRRVDKEQKWSGPNRKRRY